MNDVSPNPFSQKDNNVAFESGVRVTQPACFNSRGLGHL